jgi:hypothetical protein
MTSPTFSVIIPAYNRKTLVRRAVQSVLAQHECDFEVLVVDDASMDGSWEMLSSLGDPRVRVLRHPINKGGSAARNTGLAAARGSFVAFLPNRLAPEAAQDGHRLEAAGLLLRGLVQGVVQPRLAAIDLARVGLRGRILAAIRNRRPRI